MKVLVFPYFQFVDLNQIQSLIDKNTMKCFVNSDKKQNATFSYSNKNHKFIIHPDCAISENDIKKAIGAGDSLGNGISRGTVNKKPYTWIVLKGGSDVSKKNLDKIYEILKQENIKGQVA